MVPLDVSGIVVKGFIDGPQDVPTATPPTAYFNGKYYFGGCGTSLPTNSNILSSGQEIEGVLRCFNLGKNIYYNNTNNYSYLLTIDQANKIPEANENNNSTSYSFSGYQGQYPAAAPASQYYLTEAFVIINTDADHKEQESEVNFRLIPSQTKNLAANDRNEFVKRVAKNELPFFANSSTTLPLGLFMSSSTTIVNPPTTLEAFKQNGLGLVIEYKPNFITDAWKIEQVNLVLCFKDANGVFHPTEGKKTISFGIPANTFLDGFFKHFLACKADGNFNPGSVRVIEKLSDY